MSVQIIVDSTVDMPDRIKECFRIVPLTVHFGSEEFIDGVTIDKARFYERLVESDVLPTTSQATPAAFQKVFEEVTAAGDSAVVITISSKLSGTYQSACIAAADFDNIFVVDSMTAAIGSGILAEHALKLAEAGMSAEQIAEKRKKKAPAYRLMVPDADITFTDGCMGPHTENLLRDCGDFYLRRADGVFAYQLAVVVDDARMGVTEVVRGADLLSSTARQLYLYRLLGLPAPKFAHCPLLLAPDGRRLSKRDGDQSLENLRAKYTAEEIVGRLAFAYGLQPEPAPRTPESLIPDFSWDKVPKQDICLPEGLF